MITTTKAALAAAEEHAFDSDNYVIDFLRDSPEFFSRNPELLLELEVPHQHRGAVSLVERRLSIQREQFTTLQDQLTEIVDVAHQNDHLSELLHDYSIGLISAGSLADVFTFTRNILQKRLRCELSSAVILRNEAIDICLDGVADYVTLADKELCTSMSDLHSRRSVYCGYPISNRVEQFFPKQRNDIKSIAIIRLANTGTVQSINDTERYQGVSEFGYLALASDNKERFAPHMGTDFLSRFGALLSARLAVFY